jgi:predicted nucleotidyltransferase
MPGGKNPDPEYVAARRVLLDALDALGAHRKSVVLVGAQAIDLHVGEGDLAVSPYTTDGDLAIDPRALDDEPALAATLESAGFALTQLSVAAKGPLGVSNERCVRGPATL